MRVARIAERLLEFGRRNPLGEEVRRHLGVRHVFERDLTVLNASLEDGVAPKEMLRARWTADAGGHLLVGQVVGADERRRGWAQFEMALVITGNYR